MPRPVPVSAVELHEGFWFDRVSASRERGLSALLDRLESHGVLANFRRRAGEAGDRAGYWFTDSDLYKWMEALAWAQASRPDPALAVQLDALVEAVLAAQDASGYLNTNFEAGERFTRLDWSHELYCLGHLIEAAVAIRQTTGDDRLLDAARRFAGLVQAELGEDGPTDLHPGVELALVALARETGEERWAALARALCDRVPVDPSGEMWGHAVRALYFACGLADLAGETGEGLDLVLAQWERLVTTRSYVTGGVGGRWIGESVGRPFELPQEGSYAETCAGIAAAMLGRRLLELTGEARFADHMETVLHNAVLAGVSLAGDEWFYANPLATAALDEHDPWATDNFAEEMAGPFPLRRRPWRDVTCCPPNVLRTLMSFPGWLYGASEDGGLRAHLLVPSRVRHGGWDVTQRTGMPWEGWVEFEVAAAPAEEASLHVRIPSWAGAEGYRELRRAWQPGEVTRIEFDLDPRALVANPRVAEMRGSVALARGPFVYCFEGEDNPGIDVVEAGVDPATLGDEWRADLLGGVVVMTAEGSVPEQPWGRLYRRREDAARAERPISLSAIPYYAWANRGPSPMTVFMRTR